MQTMSLNSPLGRRFAKFVRSATVRHRESEARASMTECEETKKLEEMIRNPIALRDMINHLLHFDSKLQLQVRFVSYVLQFEDTRNKQERRLKGQAIVEMFLLKSSRCRIDEDLTLDGCLTSVEYLSCIKKLVLAKLVQADELRDMLME